MTLDFYGFFPFFFPNKLKVAGFLVGSQQYMENMLWIWEPSLAPVSSGVYTHAIASIKQRDLEIYDFVHSSMLKSCYEQVYSHYVKPINRPELLKKTGKGIVLALTSRNNMADQRRNIIERLENMKNRQ